jgi:hypothetical protein
MKANIMNTRFFHKMKYDLRDHYRGGTNVVA